MKSQFKAESIILELRNICVHYGSVMALQNLSLNIRSGEIHGIVGEHGAGKSTLAKVVANLIQPESGQVLLNNKPFGSLGYKNAIESGIRMIFQKMQLNNSMTVADNILLSNSKLFVSPFHLYRKKRVQQTVSTFLKVNNFDLDPLAIVAELNLSERALLSIVKNLYSPPSILILDEAMEKLSASGLEQVLNSLKKLRASGSSVLFITHRVDDLYTIADRVSVMRDGEVLITEEIAEIDKINLIKLAYAQFSQLEERTEKVEEFDKLLKYNEAVLKQLPINLLVSNHANEITLINKSAENFFSIKANSKISLDKLLANNPPIIEFLENALEKKKMQHQYNTPLKLNSKTLMVNLIVYPIIDNSILIGNMLIIEDITEREHLREQLILSEKLASIGLLAAGVAHEINNPLAVICNYLESIKQNKLDAKERKDTFNYLFDQVDYITQVIGNLISFSENKNEILDKVDIWQSIKEVIDLIKFNGKNKHISIDFSYKTEDLYVHISRNEIKQVILNLFKNAFEAMPDGGKIIIRLMEEIRNNISFVVIKFIDTGTGIDIDEPNDIFLPFKSTKNTNNNFGLGLSLCYNILTRYNGEITVSSPPGFGCEFEISIPKVVE